MTDRIPYSLPEGVTELSGGVVAGGRFVAWGRPDGIFAWGPGAGWRRLEGAPPAFDSLLALPTATVVITRPPCRLGLWRGDCGQPLWWEAGSGGEVSRVVGDGRYVVLTIDECSARSLVVLAASEEGWSHVVSLPFPQGEDVCLAGDLGGALEVVSEKGLWTVSPGADGWKAKRVCSWTWDGRGVSQWHRVGSGIAVEEIGSRLALVDRATGERVPKGLRAVEEGAALLEAYLSGNRPLLRAHLEFLARLPRSSGCRALRELLLLAGPGGPVAALTPFGVITADSEALLPIPVWKRPSEVFVLSAEDLIGWRLVAWPEETLPEAGRQIVESLREDLAYGLFELRGERAIGEVLRSVPGGSLLGEIPRCGGLAKLVGFCGRGADRDVREGLESEETNALLVSMAVLRLDGKAPGDENALPRGWLAQRLVELAAHHMAVVRRDALLTIGETGQETLRGVVEDRLRDVDGPVRSAAAEALLRLDPANEAAAARVGAMSREDLDARVREEAVSHLANVAGRSGAREVVASLKDADVEVRLAAGNGVVSIACALDAGQFLEAADAALLDLVGDVLSRPPWGSSSIGHADLPERIENVLAGSTDPADSREFVALPGDLKRNWLRAAMLRAVVVKMFGKALDPQMLVSRENARLRSLLAEEKDDGLRGLVLSDDEAEQLEDRTWNRHDLARFCLRIRAVDLDLFDRLALLVPLLHRPGPAHPEARGGGSSLAARLRAVGKGGSAVDVVLGRTREIAGSGEILSPVASMALMNLDGAPEASARARRWVQEGGWLERPSVLARFVLLFEEEAACELLADAICDARWPLASRCRVERAVAGRKLLSRAARRFLPYLEEIVAFRELPPAERLPYVWETRGEVRAAVRKAYLDARVAEGGLTPEDEAVGPPVIVGDDSEPPF